MMEAQMRFLINEQIYFDTAIESARQARIAEFKYVKRLLENRDVRIDTMKHHVEFMRDLRKFKKFGRGRP